MNEILKKLSVLDTNFGSCIGGDSWIKTKDQGEIISVNPSNTENIASVYKCSEADYERVIDASSSAFVEWRKVPAPIRGQLIFLLNVSYQPQ